MQVTQKILPEDLRLLNLHQGRLHKAGKLVTTKVGRRLVVYLGGVCYDAAALAYYITSNCWPQKTLKFLDDNPMNLAYDNLVMSDCRKNKTHMVADHAEYKRREIFGTAEPKALAGRATNKSRLAGAEKKPVGRPRTKPLSTLPVIEGREWRKYKGQWVSTEPAKGPWDDFYIRAARVVASGDLTFLRPGSEK